jgi:hypothetical protein
MTNLEWLQKAGMIAINCLFNKECEEIGVNIVISLRNKDYENFDEKGFDWLLEEHKEPIKLTKFEYDLLMSYINKGYYFKNFSELKEMRSKGYFKGITDTSMKIQDILKNCEVIE